MKENHMKLFTTTLAALAIALPGGPTKAQTAFQTQCRQWENNQATATFPCVVKFASDGYVNWINTSYGTYSRGNGWTLGVRNKECLRSTGGGYQVAICPITN